MLQSNLSDMQEIQQGTYYKAKIDQAVLWHKLETVVVYFDPQWFVLFPPVLLVQSQVVSSHLAVHLALDHAPCYRLFHCPVPCLGILLGIPCYSKPHWFVWTVPFRLCILIGLYIVNPALWSSPVPSLLFKGLYSPQDPPLYTSPCTPGLRVFHPWTLLGNKPSWNLCRRSLPHLCLCPGCSSTALIT